MRTNPEIPTDDIVNLAKLVLMNNNFEFDGKHFLQKRGTGIGTRIAPAYANIQYSCTTLNQSSSKNLSLA